MEHRHIDAIERAVDCATIKRPISAALGTEHVAINQYELAPGDSFAYGYHRHADQEEIFVVHQGTVTFETEAGEFEIGPSEVIRFAPGEFQQGTNRGTERVIALAIGAPQDGGESEIFRYCPDCEERTRTSIEWTDDDTAKITICGDCGTETGRFT
ncbi:MAG: cupin domain-containing protein [Salinirussus sp.]